MKRCSTFVKIYCPFHFFKNKDKLMVWRKALGLYFSGPSPARRTIFFRLTFLFSALLKKVKSCHYSHFIGEDFSHFFEEYFHEIY